MGYRQLWAFAMRHYPQMPSDPKGKELLMRSTTNVDKTVLRDFAELAEHLAFELPEITALKQHPTTTVVRTLFNKSKPLFVADGAGVRKKRRCRLPSVQEYLEDSDSLFIH